MLNCLSHYVWHRQSNTFFLRAAALMDFDANLLDDITKFRLLGNGGGCTIRQCTLPVYNIQVGVNCCETSDVHSSSAL